MRIQHFYTLCILFCLLHFGDFASAQDSWLMSNANIERTSCIKNESILYPPFDSEKLHWIWAESMTFDNNTMYMGVNGGPNQIVAAAYPPTDFLWTYDIDSSGGSIGFVPAISENIILGGGQSATGLHGINRETGERTWFREMKNTYSRNPVIDENRVYIATDSFYCLSLQTGNTIWSNEEKCNFPCVDGTTVYTGTGNDVYAFNKVTGELRWKVSGNYYYGTINQENLFVGGEDKIVCYNKVDGSEKWSHEFSEGYLPGLGTGALALSENYLCYVIWSNDENFSQIFILDIGDGSIVWSHTFDVEGTFSPTIANGVVYTCNWIGGKLWGFDISNGDVLYSNDTKQFYGQGIVANHSLFIQSTEGLIEFGMDETNVSNELSVENEYIIYPNPVSNHLDIKTTSLDKGLKTVIIRDIFGNKVYEISSDKQQKISLNLNNLAPGNYFLQVNKNRSYPIIIQ